MSPASSATAAPAAPPPAPAPRILVLAPRGQVGWELMRTLQTLGEVVPAGRGKGTARQVRLDLAAPETIRAALQEVRPTLVVNAAAYTAVDKAEEEQELAQAINGEAPGVLAEEAAALGAPLVHYSTDYVFNGRKAEPYTEADLTAPLNAYGRTKLAGEEAIRATRSPHLILRTSWVYGNRGTNFLAAMLRLLAEREELKVVADQFGAPTWSRAIAEATGQILAAAKGKGQQPFASLHERGGTYHLTSGGMTTWHGFAAAIQALLPEGPGRACRLAPIPTAEYPTAAERPRNSVLNNARVRAAFGVAMPPWRRALEICMASRDGAS